MPERGDIAYLDFAATSALRPDAVVHAVADYLTGIGATPGRGGHRLAVAAGRVALRCRQLLARLLGIPGDPGRIAFMFNATHALNTALHGVLRRGDVLVVTSFDHNAVLRPAHRLATRAGVHVRLVPGTPEGALAADALERALDGASLLSINAGSNVLGTALDVPRLAAMGRAAGARVLVDVAQTAGHLPVDVASWDVDLVAITGHKALLGPQGIGALWVRDGIDVEPLLTGGTGGNSLDREMPAHLPDHLEAGTQNAPGMAGLSAGVAWLLEHGVETVAARTTALAHRLARELASVRGLRVRSPHAPALPIVTVTADAVDPATLAARLDRVHGVLARPGLHCAPEAHGVLGTADTGAVRFSLGWCSTEDDVDRAIAGVHEALEAGRIHAPAAGGVAASGG
jgi:selenocysteine lyase/cysteine desulfurase